MTAWPFRLSVTELGAALALGATLLVLIWAAVERGHAHRWWRRHQHEPSARDLRLPHWCAAVGTFAGCV
jgi:hypothetical protein